MYSAKVDFLAKLKNISHEQSGFVDENRRSLSVSEALKLTDNCRYLRLGRNLIIRSDKIKSLLTLIEISEGKISPVISSVHNSFELNRLPKHKARCAFGFATRKIRDLSIIERMQLKVSPKRLKLQELWFIINKEPENDGSTTDIRCYDTASAGVPRKRTLDSTLSVDSLKENPLSDDDLNDDFTELELYYAQFL